MFVTYCTVIIFLYCGYVFFPLIVYLFPSILIRVIFPNYLGYNEYLNRPEKFLFNYRNLRNFRIKNVDKNYELGAWQIICTLDETIGRYPMNKTEFDTVFANGRPIILYLHGNRKTRGAKYRVKFYHLLRENGFHILTFDYRGYGDSTGTPLTEDDVLEDAYLAYDYLMNIASNSSIFIWGHSLGTGVASLLMNNLSLSKQTANVMGVFLEAPFTSIPDVMKYIMYLMLWRNTIYFHKVFQQGYINQKITFNSTYNLQTSNVPILILHAEDDNVVSFDMGVQLYYSLLNKNKVVFMKQYSRELGYGHSKITTSPEINKLIVDFIAKAVHQNSTGQKMYIDTARY